MVIEREHVAVSTTVPEGHSVSELCSEVQYVQHCLLIITLFIHTAFSFT